jgi:hypothetical protein
MSSFSPPSDDALYVLFRWVLFLAGAVGIGALAWTLIVEPIRRFVRSRRKVRHPADEQPVQNV